MCLKQMTLSKSDKIFHDHPVLSDQNKLLAENILSSENKRKQQTTKHNWIRFLSKLCQLILRIYSTIYGFNISWLFFY